VTQLAPDSALTHRKPQRKQGLKRFDLLLDTVEALLEDPTVEDISLALVAERAGVPISSLYHFFPNRDSAYFALAQRFHQALHELAEQPLPHRPASWQELIEIKQRNGAHYLNAHPAALRLFMGAGMSMDVRNLDMYSNARLARGRAEFIGQYFHTEHVENLERHLAIAIGLADGIWAVSYSETKEITPYFLKEATRATILYLRSYLPEFLAPRLP